MEGYGTQRFAAWVSKQMAKMPPGIVGKTEVIVKDVLAKNPRWAWVFLGVEQNVLDESINPVWVDVYV